MNILNQYAFLNWRMDSSNRACNYYNLAKGYNKASVMLFETLIEDNVGHDADIMVFPALFCAYQSIELYLKSVAIYQCEANGINQWDVSVLRSHKLNQLLDLIKGNDSSLNNSSDDNFNKLVAFIDLCVKIGKDNQGSYHVDFLRYPEELPSNKSGNKQIDKKSNLYSFVQSDTHVYRIDYLYDLVTGACDFLEGYYLYYQNIVES